MKHSLKQTLGKTAALAAIGLAGLAATGAAQAGNVAWSVGINLPPLGIVGGNAYAPAPVYDPAPQVVYQAPPMFYRPAPRVYYPAPPVAYGPPAVVYGPSAVAYGPPAVVRPFPRWHDERVGYWQGGRWFHRDGRSEDGRGRDGAGRYDDHRR